MRHIILIICAITVLFSIKSTAQEANLNEAFWFEGGMGGFQSVAAIDGFTVTLGAAYQYGNYIFRGRYMHHDEFNMFGPDPSENFHELGLLAGKTFYSKYLSLDVSAGLGIISGIRRGDFLYMEESSGWFDFSDPRHYEKDLFFLPAIPLSIDASFKPVPYLGIGLSLYGNLNPSRPLCGIGFRIMAGKLR